MSSSCPFCDLRIPLPALELHVNDHLVEDELARDRDLAQKIASAPSPPIPVTVEGGELPNFDLVAALEGGIYNGTNDYEEAHIQEKISCLVCLQLRSTFYKVEGGLMALLKKCLEMESGKSVSIISGHIDHFQSIQSEDKGWGCGWRNIQMLSSHLLMQRQEAREVMFGASGFVPDIPSLQRWLEIAWERGFDMIGSDSFKHKIYGSTKWIGAAECATLFRSFGLRARIVDFDRKMVGSSSSTSARTKANEYCSRGEKAVKQVYGPMDKFLQVDNSKHKRYEQAAVQRGRDLTAPSIHWNSNKMTDHNLEVNGHQLLAEWVWNYFSEGSLRRSGNCERINTSEKTPLYYQHDGHSRTIVGVQIQKGSDGMSKRHSLLVLDPAHMTEALERSLRENHGWQKLIKRGVHTLREPQYQVCYVDAGIADGTEMEQLKTLDSFYFEY